MTASQIFLATLFLTAMIGLIACRVWSKQRLSQRRAFIETYPFPPALRAKLLFHYPDFDGPQVFQVLQGLRQYFLICLEADAVNAKRSIGMPSKAVDDAWHEFILISREYSRFCDEAFGAYLHHTPAETAEEPQETALARTLGLLRRPRPDGTHWATLGGLPLIFALDQRLNVNGGYRYDAKRLDALESRSKSLRQHSFQGGGDGGISLDFGDWGGGDSGCSSGCGGGCGS